jgi:hypothetical protein
MRVGDSLVERIQQGIEDSSYLAVILSPRSVNSVWVRREVNAAFAAELERRSVFVLPVLAEDCDIPLFLKDKLYADFRTDYLTGLRAVLRTVVPGRHELPPVLIFDSMRDDPKFSSWGFHFSDRTVLANVQLVNADVGGYVVIAASEKQTVGLNKSVATLHGQVQFEYNAEGHEHGPEAHLYFAMIPMQETGYGRTGVIEVGGNVQADARNPRSPHRIRLFVPRENCDGQWHVGSIDFDFRRTETAFYSIFAVRINEGALEPAAGRIAVRRVQLYSW